MNAPMEFHIAHFDDRRNVNGVFSRVIYARETTTHDGQHLPEGWVLPGGKRTPHYAEAMTAAANIDKFFH